MLVFGFAIASVTANACGLAPSCSTYGRRSSQVGGVGSIPFTVMVGMDSKGFGIWALLVVRVLSAHPSFAFLHL